VKILAMISKCLIFSCGTVQDPLRGRLFMLLADRSRRSGVASEFVGCKVLRFVHLVWNNFFFPGLFRHEVLKINNQKTVNLEAPCVLYIRRGV